MTFHLSSFEPTVASCGPEVCLQGQRRVVRDHHSVCTDTRPLVPATRAPPHSSRNRGCPVGLVLARITCGLRSHQCSRDSKPGSPPPDNSREMLRRHGRGRPGRAGVTFRAPVALHAVEQQRELHVLGDRQRRDEMEELEDEADLATADPGSLTNGQGGEIAIAEQDASAVGLIEATGEMQQRRLARSDSDR